MAWSPCTPIDPQDAEELNALISWIEHLQEKGMRIKCLRLPSRTKIWWGTAIERNRGFWQPLVHDIPVRFF